MNARGSFDDRADDDAEYDSDSPVNGQMGRVSSRVSLDGASAGAERGNHIHREHGGGKGGGDVDGLSAIAYLLSGGDGLSASAGESRRIWIQSEDDQTGVEHSADSAGSAAAADSVVADAGNTRGTEGSGNSGKDGAAPAGASSDEAGTDAEGDSQADSTDEVKDGNGDSGARLESRDLRDMVIAQQIRRIDQLEREVVLLKRLLAGRRRVA